MKILCTVCARGGSKRLPGKNMMLFNRKPLLWTTLQQASVFGFDDVVFSSDSNEYLDYVADKFKVFLRERPKNLATDTASKLDTIRDALLSMKVAYGREYDLVVDLPVTAPLRLKKDITESIKMLQATNVVSVYEEPFVVDCNCGISPRKVLNGAVYVWKTGFLKMTDEVVCRTTDYYVMPKIRSIDIDTIDDFKLAGLIYEKGLHNI